MSWKLFFHHAAGPWYHSAEWWTAIGTIILGAAAFAALFLQDIISHWYSQTQLSSSIRLAPPDCHVIQTQGMGYVHYVRMKVENIGKNVAQNVEVMIDTCWRIQENGAREKIATFLPMNLVWSHYGGVTMPRILSEHFRHCDIGFVGRFRGSDPDVLFHVDTAVQPNSVAGGIHPNLLSPGKYQFDLLIGADNVPTYKQSYQISFADEFYLTEEEMFSKSLSIHRL